MNLKFLFWLGFFPHSGCSQAKRTLFHEDFSFASLGCGRRHVCIECLFKCPQKILKMWALSKITLLVLAGMLLSCTSSGYPFKSPPSGAVPTAWGNHTGNAYFWNGMHYTGGRYERGQFSYSGHLYTSRYMLNGRYLYGGSLRCLHGEEKYPAWGYSSTRRAHPKHRYYQPFHRHH